ncbi:MAG: DNA replication/repair protein RecF [Rickettsiales bacterium]|nr:DNA replication/repair protein RecF [Rickettsiales bacterium]
MQPNPHIESAIKSHAIKQLTLSNFRNYESLHLDIDAPCIVLQGHNGAGKTNILEAISLLSPGRGLRKAKLREMSKADSDQGWVISAQIDAEGITHQIGTAVDTLSITDKRIVKIDSEKTKSQAALAEYLTVIWQTPQMDGLFLDSNTARRSFLDRLVYGLDAAHLTRVNAYDHALRERNKLLQDSRADHQWLCTLEQRMAEQAVAIADARLQTIKRLNQAIAQSSTGFPKAIIHCEGEVESMIAQGEAAVDIEEQWLEIWQNARNTDRHAGRTLKGTHRSQLQVQHQEKNMEAAYCSTGEQKALLLSILLSHARVKAEWKGAAPIILLDEVVAHLDEKRRAELFDEITKIGAQTWLTGTDAADFSAIPVDHQVFMVKNAEITTG